MVCKRQEQCVFGEKCIYHIGSVLPKCSIFEQKPPIKQTEQEYIQTCNTKQLAKWLSNHSEFIYECGQKQITPKVMDEEDWEWWLKQPHEQKGD